MFGYVGPNMLLAGVKIGSRYQTWRLTYEKEVHQQHEQYGSNSQYCQEFAVVFAILRLVFLFWIAVLSHRKSV